MNIYSKTGSVIRYLFIASLFLSACALDFSSGDSPSDSPGISVVEIDPAHQACELPSDCVLVYVDCSGCDCGVPVNYLYEDIYINLYKEICSDYVGPVCEMYCPSSTLICQSGLCGTEPSD